MVKINIVSLTCCAGCVSSMINAGERLYDLLQRGVEVVYSPTFVDTKEIQRVDIAIVEGGVKTDEDEDLIREVRAKCDVLVAIGICATHGGITSLGNVFSLIEILEKEYPGIMHTSLPRIRDMIYPICSFVDVDYYVPGCPPMSHLIIDTVEPLIKREKPSRHTKIVCNECPRKILAVKPAHLLEIYEKESDPNICLLNQGYVCLGSLTRDGCGAPCPSVGFTCFGCRGPSDPLLYRSKDLYNVLVDIVSRRTGITMEEVRNELNQNPFIFHTFIFSNKLERFKSKERVI